MNRSHFGMIGLGVMGRNLALNVEDHGFPVAVWNLEKDWTARFLEANPGRRLQGADTLPEFVTLLEKPRRIMMMIKAGSPVDQTIGKLAPLLEKGDVIIDGGNSYFQDTRRREAALKKQGVFFIGTGVSGGEEGARHGPSLMPGGEAEAWKLVAPVLEAIAARSEAGACVAHLGPDGAGHFVKMVHNGIEYGIMQLLAESYDLLARGAGLEAPELAATFAEWNQGHLASFLLEITAAIFRKKDDLTGKPLVDEVLDKAGQKGTGRWTAMEAFELGVPVPTLTAAVEARVISSRKEDRVAAGRILSGFRSPEPQGGREAFVSDLRDALLAGSLCAYAQGMELIREASAHFDWGVPLDEVARVWMGGCIIRSGMLGPIREAFRKEPGLTNLTLADPFREMLRATEAGFRRSVAAAAKQGIPTPALASSLAWFDGMRTPRLPQNLTQAQRDAFGAHTWLREDRPDGKPIHSDWLEQRATAPGKGNA